MHGSRMQFNPNAVIDDGSCDTPIDGYDCDGNCTTDSDGDGICNGDETVAPMKTRQF